MCQVVFLLEHISSRVFSVSLGRAVTAASYRSWAAESARFLARGHSDRSVAAAGAGGPLLSAASAGPRCAARGRAGRRRCLRGVLKGTQGFVRQPGQWGQGVPARENRAKQGLRVRPSRAAEEPLCAAALPRGEGGKCWAAGPLVAHGCSLPETAVGVRACEDRGVDVEPVSHPSTPEPHRPSR